MQRRLASGPAGPAQAPPIKVPPHKAPPIPPAVPPSQQMVGDTEGALAAGDAERPSKVSERHNREFTCYRGAGCIASFRLLTTGEFA